MKKKSSHPYHPYHGFKKMDKIINDVIISYKDIFFNWLKVSGHYNFYRDAYYAINGNGCDFNKLILSYFRKHKNNFIVNDLKVSSSFFQATIGYKSNHDYFHMDDVFEEMYHCRMHWEDYISTIINVKKVSQLKSHS